MSDKSTYKIFGSSKSSEKISLDCTSIQLVLIFRKLSDIYYDVQTVLSARFSKGFRFKSLSTNKLLVVITVYEFQIVETYVCQSFQTLYEASPIINVTQNPLRSFIQSCTLPTDPLRPLLLRLEIFSGYTIQNLYYAGVSIMPLRGQ